MTITTGIIGGVITAEAGRENSRPAIKGIDAQPAILTKSPAPQERGRSSCFQGRVLGEGRACFLGLGQADPGNRATDVSFNVGFDWEAAKFLRVLASAGTGIASDGRERIGWQGYFGLQWLWGSPAHASDPPLMAQRRRH